MFYLKKWSSKLTTDVFVLLCAITSSAFIAAVLLNWCMFEYIIDLTKWLQGYMQDDRQTFKEVTLAKDIFIDIRQNADAEYNDIYKRVEMIAGTVNSMPRCCGRHMINNVEANTQEIY